MYEIQILQDKLMKVLLKLDRRIPTNYFHKILNICKVNDIYVCYSLNFVYDVPCGRCQDVLKITSNLGEIFMMWSGRDKLKFQ